MKTKKEVSYSLQLLIQLQKLSSHTRDSGFALLMASVMSILIFSMLTIYLFSGRLSRSTSNAMVDAGSTFYAAESELNKRANDMRLKVGNFTRPSGTRPFDSAPINAPPGQHIAAMMQSCINPPAVSATVPFPRGSGDFACVQNDTIYSESVATGSAGASDNQTTNISSGLKTSTNIKYKSYSFVQDLSPPTIALTIIPPNNNFAGLRSTDYTYRVYSTAIKQADGATDVSAQSMLQMQFTDRFIPIFQFAAFYNGNLEITSSPPMTINGPVHSNSGIYLAPGNLLTFNGNVSYVNSINRSLLNRATHSRTGSLISFLGGNGYTGAPAACNGLSDGCVSGLEAWTGTAFPIPISAADLTRTNGSVSRTNVLRLPPTGFLSKQIGTRAAGVYWTKADLRVDFDPLNTTRPTFGISRMNQNNDPPTTIESFNTDVIDSLQKPVMLRLRPTTIAGVVNADETTRRFSEVIRLCPRLAFNAATPGDEPTTVAEAIPTTVPAALSGLTQPDKNSVVTALQLAIAQTPPAGPTNSDTSLEFNRMRAPATGQLGANFISALATALPSLSLTARTNIANSNLNDIAALPTTGSGSASTAGGANGSSGGCFLPPPMQITQQYDKREGNIRNGNMWILQSNIKSLTAWNRDGVHGSGLLSTSNKLFTRKDPATLAAADQLPNNDSGVNVSGANCDYDCLGLGSVDGSRSVSGVSTTSQGGLVWHYSLINRLAPYDYASNPSDPQATPPVVANRSNTLGMSQYGFAFSGGARLPGALTVVSDQAMYIQGDYNNPRSVLGVVSATDPLDRNSTAATANRINGAGGTNPAEKEKRPAAILGDTAIVLSNRCSDDNFKINCLLNLPFSTMTLANSTVMRAAVLAGTEATVSATETSGGLNNFLSFRESWNGSTIKYRGSMVSKGIPTEFNGPFLPGCSGFCSGTFTYFFPPARDFGFDTDFNSVEGLPPLTPNVNILIQRVYKRDYDATNRN
jgi:hypothetical protein